MKSNHDQKQQMIGSLKKYLIENGYTKTLAVLERDKVFKTSTSLSFAILKAPERVTKKVIPEKRKKKDVEPEKVKISDEFKQLALKFGLPGEHLEFFFENREKFSWERKKKMVVRCSGNNCHCKFTAEVKPGSLVDHMIDCHEYGEYPCDKTDCSFTGYSTHSLKHHLNKFHGTAKRASSAEQKHRCKYASCSYIAPTTSALESHHRVHENRSIRCEFCHYRAFQAHIMYEHMMSHFNIKPIVCDICDKSFRNNKILNKHMMSHSKDFTCSHCDKSFERLRNLQTHLQECEHRWSKFENKPLIS